MKVTKAVFPVAGWGTRFLPATKAQPKEMLPLVDKPVIQYAVEEAAASGAKIMILVTGRGKGAIENHFDVNPELEKSLESKGKLEALKAIKQPSQLGKFVYARQSEPLGLGHAVLMAKEIIADDKYFCVFLPDDVMDCDPPCMKQMIAAHEKVEGAIVAVMKTDAEGQKRYGIVKVEPTEHPRLHRIIDIVEKPGPESAPSNLAVIGRYILPREIFEEIEKSETGAGGEIQLTDAIRALLKKKKFYAYEYIGERLDAGEVAGYVEATLHFGLKRPELKKDLSDFIKNLR